ncbi:MAG: hypothetical protein H0V51_14830, partial [Chloroflexi bacterium]|nr:hypothetical protein [Chloroflexota bacterium]
GIPTVVEGMDREWWPKFNFFRSTRVNEIFSGIGPIGGLMLVFALAALLWPGRVPPSRRLLGFGALSYLVLMTLTLRWSPYAAGRFLLIACAFAAPLLGALLAGSKARNRSAELEDVWWREGLAVLLVVWSGVTGLYVATFNEDRPLARLGERDRIGLMTLRYPILQKFFRELEQELGPTSTVGIYGAIDPLSGQGGQWQYPLFGSRFSRTVLPLVPDGYLQRPTFKRPLPWSNETLVNTYPPAYIVVESAHSSGDQELPQLIPGRCFPVPLLHGKPTVRWEVWRCQDWDPRSVLENGDFRAWSEPSPTSNAQRPTRTGAGGSTVDAGLPIGWEAEVADQASLVVSRLDPDPGPGQEPFRLRLDYRAGRRGGEAGIVQEVPLDGLHGRVLMVDARVLADRAGAAMLSVDDGETVSDVVNQSSEAETLRVEHTVHPGATELRIRLQASEAGRDAAVLVRTILAIHWEIGSGLASSDG